MGIGAIFIVAFCIALILLGIFIFIRIVARALKGHSSCWDCKNCRLENCPSRRKENSQKD